MATPLLHPETIQKFGSAAYSAFAMIAVSLVVDPAAYAMVVRNSESKQRVTHLREKLTAGS